MIVLASDCFRPDRAKYDAALKLLKRMGPREVGCLPHSANPSYTHWAMGYDTLKQDQARKLTDLLPNGCSLIIGFEMSPGICKFLEETETAYINLSYHPVRFCEDLFFLVRTSLKGLEDFYLDISASIAQSKENLHHAAKTQGFGPIGIKYQNIVVEQLPLDASTIENGFFLGVTDVVDRFLLKEFHVLRHPFGNYRYRNELNASAYVIMSIHKDIKLFGISSSLLHEAEYFQVTAQKLVDHPSRVANSMDSVMSLSGLASAFDHLGLVHDIGDVSSLRQFTGTSWKRKG